MKHQQCHQLVDETKSKSSKEYVCTEPVDWTVLKDREDGRTIEPIPFTSKSEEFSVKITDEEVAELKDDNGDIRFTKAMEFCLSCFDCDCPVDDGAFGPQIPPL